jgi:hypothetical protein
LKFVENFCLLRLFPIFLIENMVFTVNGGWSLFKEWTDWGECTVTCGGGLKSRNRTRSCTNPIPKYRGLECEGNSSEEEFEICNTDNCPSMLCLNGICNPQNYIGMGYLNGICKGHTCSILLCLNRICKEITCPVVLCLNGICIRHCDICMFYLKGIIKEHNCIRTFYLNEICKGDNCPSMLCLNEICKGDNCPSMICLNGIFIRNGDISTFYFVEISKEHTCLSILYWFEIYYTSRHICPKMLDLNTTENAINHYKQIILL